MTIAVVIGLLLLVGGAIAVSLRRVPDGVCPMCKDEIHRGGYTHRGVTFCSEACAVKDWEFQTGW